MVRICCLLFSDILLMHRILSLQCSLTLIWLFSYLVIHVVFADTENAADQGKNVDDGMYMLILRLSRMSIRQELERNFFIVLS